MAAQTVVIEVIANFKDMITPNINRPRQSMDRFNQSIDRTQDRLSRLGGTRASPTVGLVDKASSRLSEIERGLKGLGGKVFSIPVKILNYATKPLQFLKNSLFSIKGLVAAIGTGMAANKLIAQPISLADSYSSAKIGFSTLLGEEQGQQMMDDLDEFARKTPFNTSDVIANAQKMLGMGWDAGNIIEDMEVIGNAASATGKGTEGLSSIMRALAQIKTHGKVYAEELIKIIKYWLGSFGYSGEETQRKTA